MKILNFRHFLKKYNLKNDTMNESDSQIINFVYTQEIRKYIPIKDL